MALSVLKGAPRFAEGEITTGMLQMLQSESGEAMFAHLITKVKRQHDDAMEFC